MCSLYTCTILRTVWWINWLLTAALAKKHVGFDIRGILWPCNLWGCSASANSGPLHHNGNVVLSNIVPKAIVLPCFGQAVVPEANKQGWKRSLMVNEGYVAVEVSSKVSFAGPWRAPEESSCCSDRPWSSTPPSLSTTIWLPNTCPSKASSWHFKGIRL